MFFSQQDLSVELLGVFKLERPASKSQSRQDRSYDSISFRQSGSAHFTIEGKPCSVKRGDLLYLPQNVAYSQKTEGETVFAIHLIHNGKTRCDTAEQITVEDPEAVEGLILELHEAWTEKKAGYSYLCASLLYRLLYLVQLQAHRSTASAQRGDLLGDAVQYIHTHFRDTPIRVSHLAQMAMVSETYFRSRFHAAFHLSPMQYILNLKLEYAAQLLESHLYSVAQVSEKCGFRDVKYFSRRFKKQHGMSPLSFQKTGRRL